MSLLDVSQYWIFIPCAHEMSAPVNNICALATMSLLPMEDFYFRSANLAMLTVLRWRFEVQCRMPNCTPVNEIARPSCDPGLTSTHSFWNLDTHTHELTQLHISHLPDTQMN